MRTIESRKPAITSLALVLAIILTAASCGGSPTTPSPRQWDFVVAVQNERFTVRTTDPAVAQLAEDNFRGRNGVFPAGPLLRGNGGFNAPWSWHFDPARVRFVEAAIEVCDGRPSYVEANLDDFLTGYCPWGARVVEVRPAQ